MNDLKIFENAEFGQVRTITINDKPYFVGSDIAKALGYSIPHKAVNEHCKGVLKQNIPTNSGIQNMLVITEGDVYRLIMKSKLPSAEKFESWVMDEVLPQIRQTGSYQYENMSKELQAVIVVDRRITEVAAKVEKIENDMPLFGVESDEISGHVKRRGVILLGGKNSESYKDRNLRCKVYSDIYSQLKREFGLYNDDGHTTSYKALKRKNIADAHEFIDTYQLPTYLDELIKDSNAQMCM